MHINAFLTAQTLSLFGVRSSASAPPAESALGVVARKVADAAVTLSVRVDPAKPAEPEPGGLRGHIPTGNVRRKPDGGITNTDKPIRSPGGSIDEFRAKWTKAEAEFAKVEAEQRAFEAEHGFTRRATDALRNTYYEARAGALPQPTFSSRDDALTFALRRTSELRNAVRWVASEGRAGTRDGLAAMTEQLGAKEAKRYYERAKDHGEAGRMEAFIADTLLAGAFDVSGPTHTLDGADSRLEAFTVSWRGQTLLAFDPDLGEFVQFDARGTPLIPDGARRPDGGQPQDDSQSPRVDIQA